jgi:DNA polymerase
MEPGAADPREELAELAAAVRAHVEWQADTGASGLPTEEAAEAVLARLGGAAGPARAAAAPARGPAPEAGRAAVPGHTFAAPAAAPALPRSAPAAAPAAAAPAAMAPAAMAPAAMAPAPVAPAAMAAAPVATAPAATPVVAPAAPAAKAPPPTPAATPDERRTRLALLAEEVRSCTRCGLHETRTNTVVSRGSPFAELCFLGEGPGAEEDRLGEPFVGPAGQLLDRMIAAMGYHRDEVYVCNIVKCRPPNNRKPEPAEMTSCMPYLVQQLGLVQPKVIVALGATAVQGLIGTSEGITRLRGKWKLYKGSLPIMPTFHPAYLLRQPAAKREVWLDLQEVMRHLGKAPPKG